MEAIQRWRWVSPLGDREKKNLLVNFSVSFIADFPLHIDPIWN